MTATSEREIVRFAAGTWIEIGGTSDTVEAVEEGHGEGGC